MLTNEPTALRKCKKYYLTVNFSKLKYIHLKKIFELPKKVADRVQNGVDEFEQFNKLDSSWECNITRHRRHFVSTGKFSHLFAIHNYVRCSSCVRFTRQFFNNCNHSSEQGASLNYKHARF
jgi:hypothetical protein